MQLVVLGLDHYLVLRVVVHLADGWKQLDGSFLPTF